jgi:protein-tyrosine-phosphatase
MVNTIRYQVAMPLKLEVLAGQDIDLRGRHRGASWEEIGVHAVDVVIAAMGARKSSN